MDVENAIREKLAENGIEAEVEYAGENYPNWDEKHLHDTYLFRFRKGKKVAEILYYMSIAETESGEGKEHPPTLSEFFEVVDMFDGSFEDFVDEFGAEDCKEAYRTWMAVKEQTEELKQVFDENLFEELRELALQ